MNYYFKGNNTNSILEVSALQKLIPHGGKIRLISFEISLKSNALYFFET